MELMKLRGFATPEEFPGANDTVKIQKALDTAEKSDIRKVVLEGSYEIQETLWIPSQTELVFKAGFEVRFTGTGPLFSNRAVRDQDCDGDQLIYLKGEPGVRIDGSILFRHVRYLVIEGLSIKGSVYLESCREIRLENGRIPVVYQN